MLLDVESLDPLWYSQPLNLAATGTRFTSKRFLSLASRLGPEIESGVMTDWDIPKMFLAPGSEIHPVNLLVDQMTITLPGYYRTPPQPPRPLHNVRQSCCSHWRTRTQLPFIGQITRSCHIVTRDCASTPLLEGAPRLPKSGTPVPNFTAYPSFGPTFVPAKSVNLVSCCAAHCLCGSWVRSAGSRDD